MWNTNFTCNTTFVFHCLLLLLPTISTVKCSDEVGADIKSSDFPRGFLFGASTSAYQIEGAFLEDGKSLSNWDVFCRIKGKIADGTNGDVADDHYHRYMEDIEIIQSLGLSAYRFSISWTRVLPRGRLGEVNQVAIQFYNRIIDNLLLRGIEPFVTIHHHDYPQELEDRFGGWLSPLMQEEFVYLAETCFKNFADRVKYWLTINEPNYFAQMAYEKGTYPPARCSPPFGHCAAGNSDVEPLIAMHNMLIAHAKSSKLYREQFKSKVGGVIGIVVSAFMYFPLTDDENDREAVNRALAFDAAWPLDPLVFGNYPPEMKRCLGSHLPRFSPEEKLLLKDSIDFIGLNHYGTLYAKDCINSSCSCNVSSCSQGGNRPIRGFVQTSGEHNGVTIGERTVVPQFFVVPKGMEAIISYIKQRYNNKPIYVTENGYPTSMEERNSYRNDEKRIRYHQSYLAYLARAMRKGADVRGYFIWSLMDNFEWSSGYVMRFGLYHIDRENGTLNRVPRMSAVWFRDFLSKASSADDDEVARKNKLVSSVQSQ